MICVANLPASGGFEKNSLVGLVLFSLSDLDMDLDLPLLLALPLLHKQKRNEKENHVTRLPLKTNIYDQNYHFQQWQ